MPQYTKPSFTSVWAETGSKTEPTTAKINQGWIVEIPHHEMMNWLQNRQDQFLAHVNQMGVPQWDATTEYQSQKSYVQGTSGIVYRALQTHTNRNPDTDVNGFWSVAFESAGASLLKSQNLADVPNKALARANLEIPGTADYDGRYLVKSNNLADVPNKASAREIIGVYSKQEVLDLLNTIAPAGEVAPFATTTPPSGWLMCNGEAVSRVTFSRLFAAIGTRFGVGNGTSTFNLPDLRGEFVRGWDGGRLVDPQRVIGSAQGDSVRVGANLYLDTTSRFSGGNSAGQGYINTGFGTIILPSGAETRPRNVALMYCIRT